MESNKYYTKSAQKMEGFLNKLGLVTEHEYPVGKYFIDIFCPELNIGFEFDGPYHKLRKSKDIARDEELEKTGIKMIHITQKELSLKKIKEIIGYEQADNRDISKG